MRRDSQKKIVLVSKTNNIHMPKNSRKEANEIKSKPSQKIVKNSPFHLR